MYLLTKGLKSVHGSLKFEISRSSEAFAFTSAASLPFMQTCLGSSVEFRFNDASTHEGHLSQNGELTWFCNDMIIMISHKCIKCKTRPNLKTKAVILC